MMAQRLGFGTASMVLVAGLLVAQPSFANDAASDRDQVTKSTTSQPVVDSVQATNARYLFSLNATSGRIRGIGQDTGNEDLRVTLRGVADHATQFADRPVRAANIISTGDMARQWDILFEGESPNAALTFRRAGDPLPHTIVLEMQKPTYDVATDTLRFIARHTHRQTDPSPIARKPIDLPHQKAPAKFSRASVMIDGTAQGVPGETRELDPTFVFVTNSQSGTITGIGKDTGKERLKLTLRDVSDHASQFAVHPFRNAYVISNLDLAKRWKNLFEDSPPNAVLSYLEPGDKQPHNIVVTLTRPKYSATKDTLTFTARHIHRSADPEPGSEALPLPKRRPPDSFTAGSLYIDSYWYGDRYWMTDELIAKPWVLALLTKYDKQVCIPESYHKGETYVIWPWGQRPTEYNYRQDVASYPDMWSCLGEAAGRYTWPTLTEEANAKCYDSGKKLIDAAIDRNGYANKWFFRIPNDYSDCTLQTFTFGGYYTYGLYSFGRNISGSRTFEKWWLGPKFVMHTAADNKYAKDLTFSVTSCDNCD